MRPDYVCIEKAGRIVYLFGAWEQWRDGSGTYACPVCGGGNLVDGKVGRVRRGDTECSRCRYTLLWISYTWRGECVPDGRHDRGWPK